MDSIPIVVKVAASFAPVLRQFRHLARYSPRSRQLASIYQVSADIVGGSRHRGAGWQMVKFFLDRHSGHSPLGSRLASKTGFLDQLFAIRPVTSPEIDRDGRPHSSRVKSYLARIALPLTSIISHFLPPSFPRFYRLNGFLPQTTTSIPILDGKANREINCYEFSKIIKLWKIFFPSTAK